jgi:hypothetical protein
MTLVLPETQKVLEEYVEVLLRKGDFTTFFTEDVVGKLEGIEPKTYRGKEAVRDFITTAHSQGTIKPVLIFGCGEHATVEAEFIRKDGKIVPYVATYDLLGGKIKGLKLFFTGPMA